MSLVDPIRRLDGRRRLELRADRIDAEWLVDILDLVRPQIPKLEVELTTFLIVDSGRNANPARFGETF